MRDDKEAQPGWKLRLARIDVRPGIRSANQDLRPASNFRVKTNGGDTMADAPIRLDETTRGAVASGRLVHLVTINPDGTPQVTCVHVGWAGDEIVAGPLADHAKLRHLPPPPR